MFLDVFGPMWKLNVFGSYSIPMIPSCSSPGIAKILLLATFFSCCVLTAAPQSIEFADFKDERHSQPTGSDGSSQQQPIDSVGQINGQGRRAVEPEASSNIIPGTTLSMNRKFTSYWNSSVLSASSSSSESSGGMPFLITDQPILSLTVEPGPTASDIAALAGVIEGLLNGIDPLETPTVIREITYEAVAVAPSVQAITSDIISAEGRIEANEIQALEALETVESLFEGLDSEIGSVLHDVIRGVTSGFPATASDSGNLASEVIKKASTTPQASETTIFPVPINSAPVATPAFSLTTVPSSDASQAITSPILTTRSVVGSVSKGTVVGGKFYYKRSTDIVGCTSDVYYATISHYAGRLPIRSDVDGFLSWRNFHLHGVR
ncbi:hypothetical protein F5Y05DRAFT_56344 [Hypoxylon sp. FL0543]|nr:hypothetical protein F5Y05DRAFT_56344 [Hypoxylon sp. FL0543]